MENQQKTIIRFDQPAEQKDGPIKRIVGFVRAKNMLTLFDDATLDANPRSAKANHVTSEIIQSVDDNPSIFQFKTKGILLGTCEYRKLERNRFSLTFTKPDYEGLLDGGHNMLALGTYLLSAVLDPKDIRKIKLWADFKEQWSLHKDKVKEKREDFTFKVPVELLVPSDVNNENIVQDFTMALMDICAARNNNAQLTSEAKSNQRGFYTEIKERMPDELASRIEWKTNEWESDHKRPIRMRDLIALVWIPLTVLKEEGRLPSYSDKSKNSNFLVPPQKIYASKGELSVLFDRLMEHAEVSKPKDGPIHELHNPEIGSSFDLLPSLMKLYDKVFLDLPPVYNQANSAKMGKWNCVKYKKGEMIYSAPFSDQKSAYKIPDGFVVPVLYSLKPLIKLNDRRLVWSQDPSQFLDRHMAKIAKAMALPMKFVNLDPQKFAKSEEVYQQLLREVDNILYREQTIAH